MIKHNAYEWADIFNVVITDPDGWRYDDTPMTSKISGRDFLDRLSTSSTYHSYGPDELVDKMNLYLIDVHESRWFNSLRRLAFLH